MARSRATNPIDWSKGKAISMPGDQSIEKAIEQEVQVLSDAGEFGRTESIEKGEMSKGDIRAIYEERESIKGMRQIIQDIVKAHFQTEAGKAEYAADSNAAVQKKVAEVSASILTDNVMDEQKKLGELELYNQAQEIESMGAGDDRNGPSVLPRVGTDLEGNQMETYIDEDGVFRAK